jgi:hypothetical protein
MVEFNQKKCHTVIFGALLHDMGKVLCLGWEGTRFMFTNNALATQAWVISDHGGLDGRH